MTEHAGAASDQDGGRHVLLISYHFGADGATGGFRWYQMARDLVSMGWSVDVVCGPESRAAASEQLPAGLSVRSVRCPGWATTYHRVVRGTLALLSRLRRTRFAVRGDAHNGDAPHSAPEVWQAGERRRGLSRIAASVLDSGRLLEEYAWTARAYVVARGMLRARRPRAVVVTSPRHTNQIAGARLAKRFGVPYVADFRDPWIAGQGSLAGYPTDIARILGGPSERRVVREASVVVFNTQSMGEYTVLTLGEGAPREWQVIPNGSDLDGPVEGPDPRRFIIAMTGHLHPYMDPRPVFAACGRLARAVPSIAGAMEIHFMGTQAEFGGVPLVELAAREGLVDSFVLTPRGKRAEARRLQQRAAVLLLFDTPSGIVIPMKFYDYVQVRARLLVLGWPNGALAAAASRVDVPLHPPEATSSIDDYLRDAMERWSRGRLTDVVDVNGIFRRVHQSRRVHEILVALPEPNPGAASGDKDGPFGSAAGGNAFRYARDRG